MNSSKAIVTLAMGEPYQQHWKRRCESNWRAYASRHGFDLICIEQPLDNSERARKRSPAWQKCLILSQDFAQRYERIVWIDSDILINNHAAPAIDSGVPLEKVGAVEEYPYSREWHHYREAIHDRIYEFFEGKAIRNYTAPEYYTTYGFSAGVDEVVNTGVLVLSPRHHRSLLERTYSNYEEKGGREWQMEMRPLSYELVKSDSVQWIDPRFNVMWPAVLFLHYPFLIKPRANHSFRARLKRKLATVLDLPSFTTMKQTCLTATYLNSFFLHFGGPAAGEMELIDPNIKSWRDLQF
ncbi:MAG TPA: hypothetical protein VL171_09760 [Verrucomicrobiae bacterium]|nr:hypothetical protein [Verrucomicrobiae bacterium]